MYLRTKDPIWRQSSFFWVKVYGLVFAMGIATGIVQEFEFGTNWATYSRFVGNIFGSLLAAEGIFAFFLEGGFLGLMLFGGNRLGPRLWLLAIFLVVFGAHFSALWILMANSWMQTPQGYEIQTTQWGQQAVMTDFCGGRVHAVVHPAPAAHLGGLVDGRRGAHAERERLVPAQAQAHRASRRRTSASRCGSSPSSRIAATSSSSARTMAIDGDQRAAAEAGGDGGRLGEQSCAPMYLVGWVDEATQTTTGINPIPCLLSFLAYQDIQADGRRHRLPSRRTRRRRSTSSSRSIT